MCAWEQVLSLILMDSVFVLLFSCISNPSSYGLWICWHFHHILWLYILTLVTDVSRLSEEGEMPLLEMKQKVHILSEKTAQELKKNVYKNYSQFIETAREISSILLQFSSVNLVFWPLKMKQRESFSPGL